MAEWHWHPEVIVGLILTGWVYWFGVGPLRKRYDLADRVERRHPRLFFLGLFALAVATISPIHDLSNTIFTAHMIQHLLLAFVAAPLLLLGTPDWLIRPVFQSPLLNRPIRLITHPILAFAIFNVVFAGWHLPFFYEAAVRFDGVHAVEHLTFTAAAMVMWWPIMSPMPELPRLSDPAQILYLFLLPIAQIAVFAPITFAPTVLYPSYEAGAGPWGISSLADQQTGGVIMKVVTSVVFLSVLTVVFFRWFNREEKVDESEQNLPEELQPQDSVCGFGGDS